MEGSSAVPGSDPFRVLILGGTAEAEELAALLAARPEFEATTSLAGLTRAPAPLPGKVRRGGFGGIDGLVRYVEAEGIDALIDATHPFAEQMTRHAIEAAARSGAPLLRLERPAWDSVPGDRWIDVEDVAAAARAVPTHGARAFLTVGRTELRNFAADRKTWFLVRLIEAPGEVLPLARHELVIGRGPFTELGEADLLRRHRIDAVVSKNSGGDLTSAKIAAARELGLPVIMVRRPASPPGPHPSVPTASDALAWLAAQTHRRLGRSK